MYKRIDVGVDPDSEANGVAVYLDKKLVALKGLGPFDFFDYLQDLKGQAEKITVHVEDLISCNAAFSAKNARIKGKPASLAVKLSIAQDVGGCKNAQRCVEEAAKRVGVGVKRYRISSAWKNSKGGKIEFERFTGWSGRSNEDTRSAAYFGFLGCQ